MIPRCLAVLVIAVLSACSPAIVPLPSAQPTHVVAIATTPPSPTSAPTPAPTPVPTPGLVAADLDGILTTPELGHRLPLAVAIDDNRSARPQAGFNATSVVWQAPADGYESRYLLMFQEDDAATIGPVRSARNYIAHWTAELRGALAHYGGDRLTRAWMAANSDTLFTDIDGLGTGRPAYHRITSREAPHNAYTSTAELWRVAGQLGGKAGIDAAVHVRPFREDSPVELRGTSQSITVPYRTVGVGYAYDRAANLYRRTLDGRPHVDPLEKAQVTARTVVVLYMKFRTDSTIEPGHNRPVLGFVGTGKAWIFLEGTTVIGTWSKAGPTEPTLILGPDGTELPFLRGRIFMQVVPIGTNVTVKG